MTALNTGICTIFRGFEIDIFNLFAPENLYDV